MTKFPPKNRVPLPDGLPSKMKGLRRDDVGRPVPYFVAWIDGKPDFRITDAGKLSAAAREKLCFVCGNPLLKRRETGRSWGTFVVGPMCVINRISAEPPSHDECAEWCARACPFMLNPNKGRRTGNLPEDAEDAPGVMIQRNPGVMALVQSTAWQTIRPDARGVLFNFTNIIAVHWVCEGRDATAEEVLTAMESGLPQLHLMAQEQGDEAVWYLAQQTRHALVLADPTGERWIDTRDYPLIRMLATLSEVGSGDAG